MQSLPQSLLCPPQLAGSFTLGPLGHSLFHLKSTTLFCNSYLAAIGAGSTVVNKTNNIVFQYLRTYLRSSIKLTGL